MGVDIADLDRDGYDDILVGAWGHGHGVVNTGRAFLYLGSPAGRPLLLHGHGTWSRAEAT